MHNEINMKSRLGPHKDKPFGDDTEDTTVLIETSCIKWCVNKGAMARQLRQGPSFHRVVITNAYFICLIHWTIQKPTLFLKMLSTADN